MLKQRVCKKLVIRLNSDLCVASGDGFSSSIDVDVCHDRTGRPMIPSRRLKGCLREAACELGHEGSEDFDCLFGVSGSAESGSLRLSDALIENANGIIEDSLNDDDAANPQSVLDLFTYTRAQTAIGDDGSVDDNTLRFVRVVKQYVPAPGTECNAGGLEPLRFTADISCASDEGQLALLTECCKAMRNIGYGRNRGLGAVTCALLDAPTSVEERIVYTVNKDSREQARFAYTIRLDSSLMLPQQSGLESLDYIPGTSVHGFFATKFVGSEVFDDMFLRERVQFSPLYPVFDGMRCHPSPTFAVKIKGGTRDGQCCSAWQVQEGESAKPLKGGFVTSALNAFAPTTEIVYHHSVNVAEKTLYTQRCLQPGQLFSGFITGDPEFLEHLAGVLSEARPGDISFGRSKTAQYSRCTVVGIGDSPLCNPIVVHKDQKYAFVLDSDALLESGGLYQPDYVLLESALRAALGDMSKAIGQVDIQSSDDPSATYVRQRIIAGYNSKWNQKKPHVSAIRAGSCIVFKGALDMDGFPGELYVGDRRAEGFGRVIVVPIDENGVPYLASEPAHISIDDSPSRSTREANTESSIESLRCATIDYADSVKRAFGSAALGTSFIGRLASMVEESSSRRELGERIASIKSKQKRETTRRLLSGLGATVGTDLAWSSEKECLVLLFVLGKYYAKQAEALDANTESDEEGGVR